MNCIFSLCLPVAASAILLCQTSTAQAQAQDNRFNNGRGGGGGRPAPAAAAPGRPAPAAPHFSAPRMAAPNFAARPSAGGTGGARQAPRNFAMPSRNETAARSFAPQHSVQSPAIAHNPVLNGGRSFNSQSNRGPRNLASDRQIRPNIAAPGNAFTQSRVNNNRFGNTNRFNTSGTPGTAPNAFAANRQVAAASPNSAFASNSFAYRAGNFHPGWNPGRSYYWNHHHWRCYNGVWAVVDAGWPPDWYGYPYPFAYDNVVYYGGDVYDPGDYSVSGPTVVGSSLVADVQSALDNAGYNAGPVDGDIGPQTREAIADYQQDHGMTPTGRIDAPLLDSLGL